MCQFRSTVGESQKELLEYASCFAVTRISALFLSFYVIMLATAEHGWDVS
jgi:hypothetical protein